MDSVALIEIALANVDDRRVEVTTLEPAEFSMEVVGGSAALVSELVSNAIALVGPEEKVRVAGAFDGEAYRISISQSGVGVSEELIGAINRLLENPGSTGRSPELMLGILFVAQLAARHGLGVRWIPGAPGTTAQVTIPANLVRRMEVVDLRRLEEPAKVFLPEPDPAEELVGVGHIDLRAESARQETEDFLRRVFMGEPLEPEPVPEPVPVAVASVPEPVEDIFREPPPPHEPATELRVRVPGQNFPVDADHHPSTAAAERAVDIRSALSTFDQGRRSAELEQDPIDWWDDPTTPLPD